MDTYKGTIIDESLEDKTILKKVKIISTRISKVTEKHKTPWLAQWTLHKVEIKPKAANKMAKLISQNLEEKHHSSWYADFNNGKTSYVIFRNKIFSFEMKNQKERQKAVSYGLSLGIPKYQLDFP